MPRFLTIMTTNLTLFQSRHVSIISDNLLHVAKSELSMRRTTDHYYNDKKIDSRCRTAACLISSCWLDKLSSKHLDHWFRVVYTREQKQMFKLEACTSVRMTQSRRNAYIGCLLYVQLLSVIWWCAYYDQVTHIHVNETNIGQLLFIFTNVHSTSAGEISDLQLCGGK